jgi:ribonuclease HI
MKIISIDGACRNNGKEDSYGCGACAVLDKSAEEIVSIYMCDNPCTNQRAELHGLLLALGYINDKPDDYLVVTDSEYIYNAMTKGWLMSWSNSDFIGSTGETIKNDDLWRQISSFYYSISDRHEPPCFYHIKGHILSIGKVTRSVILHNDSSGTELFYALYDKYDNDYDKIINKINAAQECSKRINGFEYYEDQLKSFVVMNTVADCLASYNLDNYR